MHLNDNDEEIKSKIKFKNGRKVLSELIARKTSEIDEGEYFRILGELAPNLAIAIVDNEGKFIYVNEFSAGLLGFSINERKNVEGKRLGNFFSGKITRKGLNSIKKAIKSGKEVRRVLEMNFNGESVWFRSKIIPLNKKHDDHDLVVIIAYDITESKDTQKRLEDSERKYRCLIEGIELEIAVVDLDGNYQFINKFGAIKLKTPPEEIPGKNIGDFYPHDFAAELIANIKNAIDSHVNVSNESLAIVDNETFWYRTCIFPIEVEDSHKNVMITFADITERKRSELQLEFHKNKIKKYSKTIVRLQEEYQKQIARDLHDIVAQELAVAKIKMEYALYNKKDKNVHIKEASNFISNAADFLRNLSNELHPKIINEKGLIPAIEWYCSNNLMNIKYDISVEGKAYPLEDYKQTNLYRIFQEIVLNINKHSGATNIKVLMRYNPEEFLLMVSDNGKGFDYNKFIENWEACPSYGLINISERVEMMNGKINIKSHADRGTEIFITIPVRENNGQSR